jgi:acetamidase/formamidase
MQTIKLNEVQKYLFDARDEPVLRVRAGESFRVETDDALTGLVPDESDNPQLRDIINDPISKRLLGRSPAELNPVVGPIYVEGVEGGDLVAIEIESIAPWRWGYVGIVPGNGALRDSYKWGPECRDAHIQLIEHLPGPSGTTADGTARYGSITWNSIRSLARWPLHLIARSQLPYGTRQLLREHRLSGYSRRTHYPDQ